MQETDERVGKREGPRILTQQEREGSIERDGKRESKGEKTPEKLTH